MRFVLNYEQKGQLVKSFHERLVIIYSSGQTVSSLSHIELITLGAGVKIYEIAGRWV